LIYLYIKIKVMKKIRLTERDLTRLIQRVIIEQEGVTAANLTDCISYITSGGGSVAEPMDPEMAGQGITIKNVEISYNPTVSPNYRSVTMSQNGIPFCSTKVG
jgi:hypothetical protein